MRYYINKRAQTNGDHEVHTLTCSFLPSEEHREYLGDFSSCAPAVRAGKAKGYTRVDGCYFCCRECNNS